MIKKMLPNKEPNPEQALIVLLIQGGAGDVLVQTPVIRGFFQKHKGDFILVLSTYAQLWENNPYVDKVISLSKPGNFYEKYIVGKNVRCMRKRFLYDYALEREFELFLGASNLRDFACRCFGIPWDGKPPDLFLSDDEKRQARIFMGQTDKKKVLIHGFSAVPSEQMEKMICGGCGGKGIGPDGNRCQMCGGRGSVSLMQKTNHLKDISEETAQHIVKLAGKYAQQGYEFLQVGLEGEPVLGNPIIDCLGQPMRDVIAMIPECTSYIFIESLFQHAAGALQKPGVVILQNTGPFFAYPEVAHFVRSREECPLKLNAINTGCWRPAGALLDLLGAYKNPKNPKESLLWECKNQTCNKITYEDLEKAFVASLEGPPRSDDGHNTLEAARQGKAPVKLSSKAKIPDLKSAPKPARIGPKVVKPREKLLTPKLTVVKNDDENIEKMFDDAMRKQGLKPVNIVPPDGIEQPKRVVLANTTEKGCKRRGRKPKNVKQSKMLKDKKE